MQVISLFSGMGGFEYAAKMAGWDIVVSCEWDEYCQRVLRHHYRESYHHGDIDTLNFETIKKNSRYRDGETTIIVGGFPCQPYSVAGKRQGKADERHKWPEMLRIIREVKPDYVVAENVYGLVSWSGGLVFEEVQTDLEDEGYTVQSYILPAAGVGAPHKRDRVFIVAYTGDYGQQRRGFGEGGSAQGSGQVEGDKDAW